MTTVTDLPVTTSPFSTSATSASSSPGSCGAGRIQCRVFSTDYCVDLNTDVKHCGACRYSCYLNNANNGFSGGKCFVESCLVGWANCNSKDEDGCEISRDSDNNNCGKCGRVCSLPHAPAICAGEKGDDRCDVEYCETGWTNDNGLEEDGYEVPPK